MSHNSWAWDAAWARCPLTTALPCSLFQGCVGDTHCQNNLGWGWGRTRFDFYAGKQFWGNLAQQSLPENLRLKGEANKWQGIREKKFLSPFWGGGVRRSEGDSSPGQLLFYNKNIFITLIFRSYLYLALLCFSFQGLHSGDSLLSASNENTI